MLNVQVTCILILCAISELRVSGYSSGAPGSVCLGQHTAHDEHQHQLSECPYKIQLGSSTYNPSDEISMELSAPDGRPFKGFLIVAHRIQGDREKSLGTFTNYPLSKAKLTFCAFDQNTVLTHTNSNETTGVQFSWKAPDTNEGDILFKYMVVTNFATFWMDIEGPILRATSPQTSIVPVEKETFDFAGVNWDECGETKGCFLYPRLCSGSDCKAAVTYRPMDDKFIIELHVLGASYISVGFSHDTLMGEDHVLACAGENGVMSVQNGRNPKLYYTRVYRTGLTDMSIRAADGKLECRLTRPSAMELYGTANGNVTFDMNKDYYLFLAWGSVYEGTDVLSHHTEAPTVSESKVNFKDLRIVRGSSLPLLTQIHGILMFVAWILFVGVTTVISRHYETGFGDKQLLGTKVWFQSDKAEVIDDNIYDVERSHGLKIHRACAIVAWSCTAAAFVIIFVHVGGLTQVAELHSYVGIALMSASTLQVIAGVLRPGPKSNVRPVFNWGHWFLGNSAHILAIVAFLLAFYSRIIPSEQREFGVIAVAMTGGLQILWTLVFEVRKCRNKTSSKNALSNEEKETKSNKAENGNWDCFFLVLYIVSLAVMTAVCILSVVLF